MSNSRYLLPPVLKEKILCNNGISSYPGGGEGVSFSLNGTTYQNNDLVNLENVSNIDDALLCVIDLTICCQQPVTLVQEAWHRKLVLSQLN